MQDTGEVGEVGGDETKPGEREIWMFDGLVIPFF